MHSHPDHLRSEPCLALVVMVVPASGDANMGSGTVAGASLWEPRSRPCFPGELAMRQALVALWSDTLEYQFPLRCLLVV